MSVSQGHERINFYELFCFGQLNLITLDKVKSIKHALRKIFEIGTSRYSKNINTLTGPTCFLFFVKSFQNF